MAALVRPFGCLRDGGVDLRNPCREVGDFGVLRADLAFDAGLGCGAYGLDLDLGGDVRLAQEAVAANGVEDHEHRNQAGEHTLEAPPRRGAVVPDPSHRPQLACLKGHAHRNDRPEGANEDADEPVDREAGGDTCQPQGYQRCRPVDVAFCRLDRGGLGGRQPHVLDGPGWYNRWYKRWDRWWYKIDLCRRLSAVRHMGVHVCDGVAAAGGTA